MTTSFLRRVGVVITLAAALGACSTDDAVDTSERPVEVLYNDAQDAFDAETYKTAATLFADVERQHPYSRWASRALLMSGYASYLDNEYEDAIATLQRFIELHPGDDNIAYAYYLRGLCYYEQITDVQRDQTFAEQARDTLQEVVSRFPDSDYARDARLKIDLTNDHLAGKHMEVGRYYLKRGQHLAAINRFRRVIEEHQTTTHVPEALHRLTEAYLALGVVPEARASAAVLGHNFPGSEWYQDSYALLQGSGVEPGGSSSWLDRVF